MGKITTITTTLAILLLIMYVVFNPQSEPAIDTTSYKIENRLEFLYPSILTLKESTKNFVYFPDPSNPDQNIIAIDATFRQTYISYEDALNKFTNEYPNLSTEDISYGKLFHNNNTGMGNSWFQTAIINHKNKPIFIWLFNSASRSYFDVILNSITLLDYDYDSEFDYIISTSYNTMHTGWVEYINDDMDVKFSHPKNWKVENYKNYDEGGIKISPADITLSPFQKRTTPEIYIGGAPYSTSGAICANTICDYNGELRIEASNGKSTSVIVEARRKVEETELRDFYTFVVTPDQLSIHKNNYVWGSFRSLEEGQVLGDIISTIKSLK